MVNANIILIGLAVAGFFVLGGIKGVSAQVTGLLGSDLVGKFQRSQSGEVVVDNLQSNASIPIPQGSQNTVNTILASQIIRTDVTEKRKFSPTAQKPKIKTTFGNPNEGGSMPQLGFTVTTNSSAGAGFGLTKDQEDKIRKQPFTDQEKLDIIALQNRLDRKSPALQKLKDSPEELVLKKRLQAKIAEQFVNIVESKGGVTRSGFVIEGKKGLNLNPNFILGGKSQEEFARDQREKGLIEAKIKQNAILNAQRESTGRQLLSTISKSGLNQKQFLRGQGVNLQGGALNARALARLQESGVSFEPRPTTEKEIIQEVKKTVPLFKRSFATDPNLSQAEKVAILRSKGGFR